PDRTRVRRDTRGGVASRARRRNRPSKPRHTRYEPFHPRLKMAKSRCRKPDGKRSRMVARSGIRPIYQNVAEIRKYVEMAKQSQASGERKLIHSGPRKLG